MENGPLKNPSHEQFAQVYARTGNASQAWREATGKTKNADVNGGDWLVKPGMDVRVDAIRAEAEEISELKKADAVQILAKVARSGKELTKDRIAALALAGRWFGWEKGTEAENKTADALGDLMKSITARRGT